MKILSWKPAVCDKVSKVIGVLCKARRYLPLDTLKTLYNSLVLPYINYCSLIWASAYASCLGPLYVHQNKAIRILLFLLHAHLLSLFSLFSLHFIYKFHVACFVFSHFNNLLPTPVSSIHILIMKITIIWLVHVLIFIKPVTSINLL